MSEQLKAALIIVLLSITAFVGAYYIIDNRAIFWGVMLMLLASRLDKADAKLLKDSIEYKKLDK